MSMTDIIVVVFILTVIGTVYAARWFCKGYAKKIIDHRKRNSVEGS